MLCRRISAITATLFLTLPFYVILTGAGETPLLSIVASLHCTG